MVKCFTTSVTIQFGWKYTKQDWTLSQSPWAACQGKDAKWLRDYILRTTKFIYNTTRELIIQLGSHSFLP